MEDRSTTSSEARRTNKLSSHSDLKASRRLPTDQSVDDIFEKNLPESGIRQVPVHVQRRTERAVVPLPRPAKEKPNEIKPENRTPNRRRRNRIDGREGSDSDSEQDDPKRINEEDDVLSMPKKESPKSRDDGSIEQEELERVRQLRMLRGISDVWMGISRKREAHRQFAAEYTIQLTQFRDQYYDRPPVSQAVKEHNEKLRDYLDENLYEHVNANTTTSDAANLTDIEEIIGRVEAGVLARCKWFHIISMLSAPKHVHLSECLSKLEQAFWSQMQLYCYSEPRLRNNVQLSRQPVDPAFERLIQHYNESDARTEDNHGQMPFRDHRETILQAIRSYIRMNCGKLGFYQSWAEDDEPTASVKAMAFVEVMVDQYWDKIAEMMCDVAISAQTKLYSPDGKWVGFLRKSRQDGRMTSNYIKWATDGVDLSKLEELREHWHVGRKKVVLDQFRASTGAIKIKVSQEFCVGLVASQPVSLLIVKNAFPTGLREVPRKYLADFGWYRESEKHSYWRCVITEIKKNSLEWSMDYEYDIQKVSMDGKKNILKVSMDDEILGLFGLEPGGFHGDWQKWVLIEAAEDCSQEPKSRPVSPLEAEALGL